MWPIERRVVPYLADSLGDRIGHRVELVGLLVEHEVVVAKVRSAHVPVEILGLQVHRENVGEDRIERAGDVVGGAFSRSLDVASGAFWRRLRSWVLLAVGFVIASSVWVISCGNPATEARPPLRIRRCSVTVDFARSGPGFAA